MQKSDIVEYLLIFLLVMVTDLSQADLVLNEVLASNSTGLQDGFGEREDWIEIYNNGPSAVDLSGYFLTDEPDFLTKWSFPSIIIPSGGYQLVIASGKNQIDPLGYPHTSFALAREGDYLALVNSDGITIADEFAPAYPEQFTDISYGIQPSDGTLRFFAIPTPAGNNTNGYEGVVKDTNFSIDRGFYDAPFNVVITTTTPGAGIRYTTDGTKPSATNGTLYLAPVAISKTTPLRAVACKTGWLSTDVDTHTYIFVDQVARQPDDPVGWPADWGPDVNVPAAVIPSDYEMDQRVADNTLTNYSVREALLDIPSVSIALLPADFIDKDSGIYANPVSRWERECSVEYIHPEGIKGFQQNCKVEIHGNASRNPLYAQKHSLRLTFTTAYGAAKLDYPLFKESSVEKFNQLVLRACFSDSWGLVSWLTDLYRPNDSMYIRDVWMKKSLCDMGQLSSYGNFVHLYVNGLYFGLYNLTERLDQDFFADHGGGAPEDWEVNADFRSEGPRWNAMLDIDPSTPAGYEQIQEYLDIDNFSDYMLLHLYADSADWPSHNGYAAANPVSGDGRFRFFVWDQEMVLDYHGRADTRIDAITGAGRLFQRMRTSSEFRLRFADRVYKHCFHEGALSEKISQSRFLNTANCIDKAIVAESARWGDTLKSTPYGSQIEQPFPLNDINDLFYPPVPNKPDYYFTREQSWLIERDNVISNYIPAIHNLNNSYALINVLREENLYPDIDPPEFSQNGGEVAASFGLTLTAVAGDIYYTLDGSDPRFPGGSINPAALMYTGAPLFFTRNPATVKTRALYGTEWSALHEADFFVDTETARAGNLVITEIHYNPAGSDDYEFLELQNTGPVRVSLNGVQISAAVDFTFGDILLNPGAYVVVVEDSAAFSNRYLNALSPYYYPSILVAGTWSGQLSNDGELIQLIDRNGNFIQDFSYNDGGAWPGSADGRGSSLQRTRSSIPAGYPEHWEASTLYHGSPGRTANSSPSVVINELMSHSNTGTDWAELLNTGITPVDISGWFLSDDLDEPLKYQIPSRAPLAPGEFVVLDQSVFGVGAAPFSFSELGEEISLVEASGSDILNIIDFVEFGAAAQDQPFGRYVRRDGIAAFTALSSATAATTNAAPFIGPVVISEIMYHPAEGKAEYVELVNITAAAVPLYDTTNTWKFTSAVTYALPPAVTLPACGRLLVTETDPATFRTLYDVPADIPVYGPWDGKLDNDGESVRLSQPGSPEPDGTVPYIIVDRVDYRDYSPWPAAADGGGASLERMDLKAFGSDAYSWYASATGHGTPGSGTDPCSDLSNAYPVITDPGALFVDENELFSIQLSAFDPDSDQQLGFSLQGEIPAGAAITSAGLFSWTPTESDGAQTFKFNVVVSDNGIPNLSDALVLSLYVREVNIAPVLLPGNRNLSTNTVPLIPYGSLWRYLDNGSDQGSLWRETAFNDSGWAAGFASLGYGDAARTILSYGPESTAKYPTTYFRHTFISGMINTSDALLIDFGQRDTPVQSGWQSYTARHEWVSSFLPQTYSAFGTTVTLNVAWLAGAFNITAQMYDAGDISSDTPDLLRDWIGTDRRFYGNPLTLTIIGLPPGVYNWLSYHHNIEIYTGLFDVTINDALGSVTTEDINISAGDLPFDSITTFRSAIVSDGSDITIVFDKHYSTLTLQSFFVMNGFKLTRQEYDTTGTLSALTLSLIRDDGAIVYLNGAEVVRDNMPAGTVDYLTHASTDVGDADEATPHVYTLSGAELITGTNTLAVEVHQHTWTSSDLYFDLSLSADYIKAGPDGLTDYTVNAGQVVRFVCQSSDADLPAQGITYALGGDAPLGAGIDPRTGLFTWNPDTRDGPAVITFTIIATDDGTPPMTDSRNFDVTVYAPITSGDLRLENGVVIWNTLPGDQYRIEYCDELRNADWNILETRTATGMTEAFTDPAFSTVKKRFYRIISLRYAE